LAYAIYKWEALAYIRDWHPSHLRMAYASQEQALSYAIREWEVIRDWTRTDTLKITDPSTLEPEIQIVIY